MIILKFGGSSIKDSSHIKNVYSIIHSKVKNDNIAIVFSAMGGTTNKLIKLAKKAKNWDLERIAIMDQMLIKMALCELMYFDEIPVKVSLNEYIEVSKYYSTNKSKNFINGILDKVISEYKKSGKIKKVGRGLLE